MGFFGRGEINLFFHLERWELGGSTDVTTKGVFSASSGFPALWELQFSLSKVFGEKSFLKEN